MRARIILGDRVANDRHSIEPSKNNIVILYGSKGDDILFLDNLKIMDEKIYMKLSEVR